MKTHNEHVQEGNGRIVAVDVPSAPPAPRRVAPTVPPSKTTTAPQTSQGVRETAGPGYAPGANGLFYRASDGYTAPASDATATATPTAHLTAPVREDAKPASKAVTAYHTLHHKPLLVGVSDVGRVVSGPVALHGQRLTDLTAQPGVFNEYHDLAPIGAEWLPRVPDGDDMPDVAAEQAGDRIQAALRNTVVRPARETIEPKRPATAKRRAKDKADTQGHDAPDGSELSVKEQLEAFLRRTANYEVPSRSKAAKASQRPPEPDFWPS